MSKTLCKLKKELKKDMKTYTLLVNQPNFVCTKCGRVANKKKNLCVSAKNGLISVFGFQRSVFSEDSPLPLISPAHNTTTVSPPPS